MRFEEPDLTISRRRLIIAMLSAGPALLALAPIEDQELRIPQRLAELERKHGGHLGVAILNVGSGKTFAYRGDERFPMCSTHKVLSAAFVLSRVDSGKESLDRRVVYGTKDLIAYSPTTERHVGGRGLTMGELCEAAITLSDNTAANLLFESFGGPAALTGYVRSLGDRVTRFDRTEPALNEALSGDPRDTTTPLAMLQTLRKTVLGPALSSSSRKRLIQWTVACQTGDRRLRAGVPKGWRVGDKTGTGNQNETNDVAVLWPPKGSPRIVTAYYVGSHASKEVRDAVLAEVGRLAASAV